MITYTLKLVSLRKETNDTITLCFKQPALKKVKYKAGQYLTLIFRINGRRYIRPYSFSSCPGIDAHLEVTVKRVPNGIVSNHIHDQLKEGDSVEAMQPMGDFVYDNSHSAKEVFLWGVGSGITPLISILKSILQDYPDVKIHLAYGNRNHEETIFGQLIAQLQEDNPASVIVRHFYTQLSISQENPYLIQGRITKERVFEIMENLNPNDTVHYICGPVGLKESVREVLLGLKVSESQIFSEDFELVKDPKMFEDIHTQNVEINFNGEMLLLEVVKGKSILEAGLDAGIELPYSCQTGNCSICKGTLVAGDAKMIGNKHRDDLNKNEFLLCCTHPVSENVKIEIN